MASVLFVVAQKNFRDEELFHAREELEKAGCTCVVASLKKGEAVGYFKKTVVDVSLDEVQLRVFDAIVFVGGSGVRESKLYENAEVLSLARGFASAGKLVCAICIAPRILASAGVVAGKKATFYPDAETEQALKQAKAVCSLDSVVVDGKIVTANGPQAARKFGQAIAALLAGS
ncbi:DJ-1/PfpI family protein [Candidatus Micrarchaeota archaeon]|nr:DJ-1/PfpI family protein [Candidatus Micrarchaeota archaeon]